MAPFSSRFDGPHAEITIHTWRRRSSTGALGLGDDLVLRDQLMRSIFAVETIDCEQYAQSSGQCPDFALIRKLSLTTSPN